MRPGNSGTGSATLNGSRLSWPAMTVSSNAASRTVRASGPTWASVGAADGGNTGTRANCGFKPNKPVNAAGSRIEPPASVPSANGVTLPATLAAAPELDPPGVLSRFHGLRVIPVRGESPATLQPNSGVVVLPTMQAPADLSLSTDGASAFAILSFIVREPNVSATPSTAIRSFTEIGKPCSALSGSPANISLSALRAAASAISGVTVTKALSVGCVLSMRARDASTTSTGETCRVRMSASSSSAVLGEARRSVIARNTVTKQSRCERLRASRDCHGASVSASQ